MQIEITKLKVVVMIPPELVDSIREAACSNGAGVIGDYSYCTICTNCVGSFMPNENANPYVGERLKLETVDEVKLEFICPIEKVKSVLSAIRSAHPYEEPGIDLFPMIDEEALEDC